MHICFFVHYTEMAGGSNFSLLELIKNLHAKGVEITLISPQRGQMNDELDKLGIRNQEFIFHPFHNGFYPWVAPKDEDSGINWLKNRVKMQVTNLISKKIAEYLKPLHVDIIHTNCSVTSVGYKVANLLGIPHVWHIREYVVEDFDWKFICGRKKTIGIIEDNAKELIFISHDLEKKYKDAYPPLRQHPVIYNGIDKKRFFHKVEPTKFFSDDLRIVMSGTVSNHKNQGELIKAISLLPRSHRDHIKCIFMGSEDLDYRERLNQFIKKNNLENQIKFLGHRNDVNEILHNAHIAVTASRCEAFGRVTVEYMMSGLAVIVSNTGANPEIVKDGNTGLVYQYGDPKDLRDKICWYMDNREKMKKIAIDGQNDVCHRFTSDINTQNIYNLYQKILAE